jgi:hypothetical protein
MSLLLQIGMIAALVLDVVNRRNHIVARIICGAAAIAEVCGLLGS